MGGSAAAAAADAVLRQQQPPWPFVALVIVGAIHVAALAFRLASHLCLCLRRPRDLRRRYGAWAVVTGPTSGIGRSVALELARRGLNLVLVGRDPAKLRDVSEAISKLGGGGVETRSVVFDLALASTAEGDEAVRRLREAVAGLDVGVVVNNAGVARPCAVYLHEAEAEAWVRMIRVNLWAVTEVTAAVLPGMVARGRGAVVNIGSGSTEAIPSFPLYSVYAATKRYVAEFSRSLYVEYKSKGIDVQCQAPLFVATNMTSGVAKAAGGGDDAAAKRSKRRQRRWLSPLFVPTADAYAAAAARWIGHGAVCMPNLCHRLQWCVSRAVPDAVHDRVRLRENLRQRALFQRLRRRPPPPDDQPKAKIDG
ncbi:very-long-chain 3-oxoacyl-CoA reductase 1-like [Oryza glaberrima]|uniref:B-keto acyl reductase n=1 Tax=Oryza glaberrima TaxID=4538 RepID=I1Q1T0_ORYGL|nr:very-long-chain 3-oxoacyl-CoA reductase 1-like [Oryza glaberrima]